MIGKALSTGILFLLLETMIAAAVINVPGDQPTIQDAIDTASSGDVIVVAPGTYDEHIDFLGKDVTVKSEQGSAVTAIDAHYGATVVTFINGEGPGAALEGFTILNGNGFLAGGILCIDSSPRIAGNVIRRCKGDGGGGIFCRNGSPAILGNTIAWNSGSGISCETNGNPVIRNNRITNNTTADGGGINCHGSSPVIVGNTIAGNRATVGGSIMCAQGSEPVISDNYIFANHSIDGCICCYWSSPAKVTGNVIMDNTARYGAGILVHDSVPLLACNIIARNTADWGGGIAVLDGAPEIACCTIVDNTAHQEGGGVIIMINAGTTTITNTIIRSNTAPRGAEMSVFSGPEPVVEYCNVENGWPGSGNIDANPAFVEAGASDYHLTPASPCLDAGSAALLPQDLIDDFENDPRVSGGGLDIGADEFHLHLYHVGLADPGGSVSFRVTGEPGASVILALGADRQVPPLPTPYGLLHLALPPQAVFHLGTIPSSGPYRGVLRYTASIPQWWRPGDEKLFQALAGSTGTTTTELTNLRVLTIE